jgi:hypothetical protein
MEEFSKLHPVVQVVMIIAVAVVLCVLIYNYIKLFRD